jgi:DNA-binding response OmpR family regulator
MKLLVVEDDPALREGLLRLLAQWGYGAEAAADGREAEAWLEQHSFDLLLLDLGLPDGDGLRLCQGLRRRPDPSRWCWCSPPAMAGSTSCAASMAAPTTTW